MVESNLRNLSNSLTGLGHQKNENTFTKKEYLFSMYKVHKFMGKAFPNLHYNTGQERK
jgi:hypothetical protein